MKRNALGLGTVALVLAVITLVYLLSDHSSPESRTPAQRAWLIEEQLACPICQGETVAVSPSVLAIEMRHIIQQQIQEGWTDAQIRQYFVARYGPSILLNPPKHGITLGIWLVPLVVFGVSLVGIGFAVMRWVRAPELNDPDALMAEMDPKFPTLTEQPITSDSAQISSVDGSRAAHTQVQDGEAQR